jgi:hypothetical protein
MSGELRFAIGWAIVGFLLGVLKTILQARLILSRTHEYRVEEAKIFATLMVWSVLWPLFCPLLFVYRKR